MIKTKVTIVLLFVSFSILLFLSYFRFVNKGEMFANPTFESTGNPFSDVGRGGFFSYFPFAKEYNTYLNNSMNERPCTLDSQCNTGNCSKYGYCDAQYKGATSTWRTNEVV